MTTTKLDWQWRILSVTTVGEMSIRHFNDPNPGETETPMVAEEEMEKDKTRSVDSVGNKATQQMIVSMIPRIQARCHTGIMCTKESQRWMCQIKRQTFIAKT
eukprot:6206577-Ditylum_brightwellii.AAC.1